MAEVTGRAKPRILKEVRDQVGTAEGPSQVADVREMVDHLETESLALYAYRYIYFTYRRTLGTYILR